MGTKLKNKIQTYFEYTSETYGEELLLNNLIDLKMKTPKISNTLPEPIQSLDAKHKAISRNPKIPLPNTIHQDWLKSESLDILNERICSCKECPLGATRLNFVFGTGNPNADIMVIGEAPGADEDEQGKPFVGRAGQLLTKILESVSLSRDEVFIANIIKCRPPNNRRPAKEEVDKCEPYLKKQIELIKPAFILSLGLTSVDTLLKKTHKMSEIRGKVMDYHNIKMVATYHPAALLRNPEWKKLVWDDIRFLRKLYDEYLTTKGKK